MFKPITPTAEQWNRFVGEQARAHVLQQSGWGDLKAAYGWSAERVALVDEADCIVGGGLLLFRRLPLRLGSMAYLPMGPYLTEPSAEAALWSALDACARRHRAAFLKWEPGIYAAAPPDPTQLGFQLSDQTVQPPNTIILDISGSDESIMARMNQGTRRKIRQSQKNDIHYYEATREQVETFTALMETTGARNEFGVHEPGYYQRAYELFVPDHAALILAEHEGDSLAGIMVFAAGDTAWYLYGASSSVKRNLMASYGVQWVAIQWARSRHCTHYDMWGIPDADPDTLEAAFQQRSDGLWGVYGFKRGWGGEVVRSLGAWDKVYNPLIYALYRLALRVR